MIVGSRRGYKIRKGLSRCLGVRDTLAGWENNLFRAKFGMILTEIVESWLASVGNLLLRLLKDYSTLVGPGRALTSIARL